MAVRISTNDDHGLLGQLLEPLDDTAPDVPVLSSTVIGRGLHPAIDIHQRKAETVSSKEAEHSPASPASGGQTGNQPLVTK